MWWLISMRGLIGRRSVGSLLEDMMAHLVKKKKKKKIGKSTHQKFLFLRHASSHFWEHVLKLNDAPKVGTTELSERDYKHSGLF
jgi:hypothetical protein